MISDLLRKYPIISDQVSQANLAVVLRELEKILQNTIEGDIVELGCYIGTTSLFIRRLLDEYEQSALREFHVYDSFEGLPPKSKQDENAAGIDFKAGELSVSKKQFLHEFQKANLRPAIIHKSWFSQLTEKDMPEHIALAFLDGDFYDSLMDSFHLVWPRMVKGGVILVDDYKHAALPGAERAVHDFLQHKHIHSLHHEQNVAVIYL